jgi:hypothetical protein
MATINLGRIKPVWQGAWDSGTSYIADDIVYYNNSAWIAQTTNTNSAPASNNANWEIMSQGFEIPSQTGNTGKALVTNGSSLSWGATGVILQVKSYTLTTAVTGTVTSSVNTFSNALSISITPSSASNKILILVNVNKLHRPDKDATGIRILRDGTFINSPSASGPTLVHSAAYNADAENMTVENMNLLDAPNTTSAITYAVGLVTHSDHTGGFNLSQTDNGSSPCPRGVSTITVMEVKA